MNRTVRQRSHSAGSLAVPIALVVAALALGGTALAGGERQAVRTDAPVVIAGQVHPAGLLELEKSSSSGHLWAVLLDGRRVAMVFRERRAGAPGFVLFRDDSGLLYLRGVQVAQVAGSVSEYVYRRSGHTELHTALVSPAWTLE